MRERRSQPTEARPGFETGEQKLVENDRTETDQRDAKCTMMENRNSDQSEPEKNELDRHAKVGDV